LRTFESECRAREVVVAGVLNARKAVEAALLRVRERFDDSAYKSALSSVPIRTGSTSRPTTTTTATRTNSVHHLR
jgi:hypothetical protein